MNAEQTDTLIEALDDIAGTLVKLVDDLALQGDNDSMEPTADQYRVAAKLQAEEAMTEDEKRERAVMDLDQYGLYLVQSYRRGSWASETGAEVVWNVITAQGVVMAVSTDWQVAFDFAIGQERTGLRFPAKRLGEI